MNKKVGALVLSALSITASSSAFALLGDEPVVSPSAIQLNDTPPDSDADAEVSAPQKQPDDNNRAASSKKMPQVKASPESIKFQQVRELVYYYAAARACEKENKSSPLHENIRMALVKSQEPVQQNRLIDLLYQGHTGYGLGMAMVKDSDKTRCQDAIAQYQQLVKQDAEAKLTEMFHITLNTPAPEKKVEDEVNSEGNGSIPPAPPELIE